MIYNLIQNRIKKHQKSLLLLIDPDKFNAQRIQQIGNMIKERSVPFIVVGGSMISSPISPVVKAIKEVLQLPIVLYPGSPTHLTEGADGLFLLSMISGRNPDLLIGHHVTAAPLLKQMNIEIISTGYMLIDGGCTTSVEYISQTRPIPANKSDIAVATAIAGEMLGMKMIYMDAGSGAKNPIPTEMIANVRENISLPMLIGGGIKTDQQLKAAYSAGADMVIIGNALEKNPDLLNEMLKVAENF